MCGLCHNVKRQDIPGGENCLGGNHRRNTYLRTFISLIAKFQAYTSISHGENVSVCACSVLFDILFPQTKVKQNKN